MRALPIIVALSIALAVGTGPALAYEAKASGHCGDASADAGVGSSGNSIVFDTVGDDGGFATVLAGLENLVTGDPGDCGGSGSGHVGAGAEVDDQQAGACYNGGSIHTDHGQSGCAGDSPKCEAAVSLGDASGSVVCHKDA